MGIAIRFESSSTFVPEEKNVIISLNILNCILKARQVHD